MSNIHKAFFAQVIANLIWGINAPINKWAFQSISPIDMVFLRLSLTVIFLFIFFHKYITIRFKDAPAIFFMGFFGITLNIGSYYLGISKTTSINGPLISSTAPLFLLIGSALFLKEKPHIKVILGNMVGVIGLGYLILTPLLHSKLDGSITGNVLILFSTIASVVATLINKDIADRYSALTLLFWTFCFGSLTFLPFYLYSHTHISHIFALPALIGIGFNVLFASLIAYFLGFWSMKYMLASRVAIFSYIQPLAGTLFAIPLLHEYPDSHFLFAMFLIFIGIFITEQHLSRKSFYLPRHWHLHRHK